MRNALLLGLLTFVPFSAFAQIQVTQDGLKYEYDSSHSCWKVIALEDPSFTSVTIADNIQGSVNGRTFTYPVRTIAKGAFASSGVESVTLSKNITSIEDSAFYN